MAKHYAISNVDAHTILVVCSVPLDSVVFPSDESRQAAMSFYVNSKAECNFIVYCNCNVSPICNFLFSIYKQARLVLLFCHFKYVFNQKIMEISH